MIMRTSFFIASLLALLASGALAQKGPSGESRKAALREKRNERILNRKELEKAMRPHALAIQACYQKNAAGQTSAEGPLNIELLIEPAGTIRKIRIVAPGVKGKGLERCILRSSKSWRFPAKPGFTNAVLPYYFLRTHGKGAGPLHSCWSAKGCPDRIRKARRK